MTVDGSGTDNVTFNFTLPPATVTPATNVPDTSTTGATADTVAATLNSLLASLRAAGILT